MTIVSIGGGEAVAAATPADSGYLNRIVAAKHDDAPHAIRPGEGQGRGEGEPVVVVPRARFVKMVSRIASLITRAFYTYIYIYLSFFFFFLYQRSVSGIFIYTIRVARSYIDPPIINWRRNEIIDAPLLRVHPNPITPLNKSRDVRISPSFFLSFFLWVES